MGGELWPCHTIYMYVSPEERPAYFYNTDPETSPSPLEETPKYTEKIRKLGRCLILGGTLTFGALFMQGDAPLPDEILLQHPDKAEYDDENLTIMTANVHSWKGPYGDNLPKVLEVMNEESVDIACIQEYLKEGDETQKFYNAGYDVYWAKTVHWPWRQPFGNAIISKPPLDKVESVSLPNPKTISPRNAVTGEIITNRGTLSVTNTHLSTNKQESALQSNLLLSHIENRADILCGDFNQSPQLLATGSLGSLVSPVFLSANAPTFPSSPHREPDREIDHIVSNCGDLVEGSTRIVDIGSDHYAKIKQIDITDCFET